MRPALLALSLLSLSFAARSLAQPASAPAAPSRSLHLLYTGQSGGVASASSTGSPILLLWQYLSMHQGSASFDRTGAGALRCGSRIFFEPEELRVDGVLPLLERTAPPPRRRVLVEKLPFLDSDHALFFQHPTDPELDLLHFMEEQNRRTRTEPSLRRTTGRLVELRGTSGRRVLVLETGPDVPPAALPDPLTCEAWFAARGSGQLAQRRGTYFAVLKVRGSGARRYRYIQEQRARLVRERAAALLLSAGDETARFDAATGKRHPLRDLCFEVLAALRYDAILPGARELYFGLDELKQIAAKRKLPLVATNLVHAEGDKQGQTVFSRYLLRQVGGLRVAILGVVGQDLAEKVREPEVLVGIKVTDPVAASNQVINDLRSQVGTRPDLVIVLSGLSEKDRAEFVSESYGVDVLIGDFTRAGLHPPEERLTLGAREALLAHTPLYDVRSSRTRVGQLRVDFTRTVDGARLAAIEHRQRELTADLPLADWLQRRMMAQELRELRAWQTTLIPALEELVGDDSKLLAAIHNEPDFTRLFPREGERWQVWFTPRRWSQLVANLLRHAADAEVAALKIPTTLNNQVPGPLLEDYVIGFLYSDEAVALYDLSGAQLKALAQTGLEGIAVAGLAVAGLDRDKLLVGGRRIADSERYRVVVGRSLLRDDAAARVLRDLEPATRFRIDHDRLREDKRGGTVRLRELALSVLRELRRRDPGFSPAYRAQLRDWLQPQGAELVPRWFFSVEQLTFSFSNYSNYPGRAWLQYPGVRETRVSMPNNYTLMLKGTLAAVYDSARIAWDTRTWFTLTRTVINLEDVPGKDNIELNTTNDLQVSTEFRLKVIELGLGKSRRITLIPYANVTFDTEFTGGVNQVTSEPYPHQLDLLSSVGLVTYPGDILQEVRLAGIVRSDFAATQGRVDAGVLFGFKVEVPIWLAKLRLSSTLRYFSPTDSDTADRLGLTLQGAAGLIVPFTRDLSVTLGADLFLFRPKVLRGTDLLTKEPVERGTAVSLILSAGISFDHLWKI